jgi:hypothetical protein
MAARTIISARRLALIFAFDEQFSSPHNRTLLVKFRKQGFFFASSMLCSFRQHSPGNLRSNIHKKQISALPHWPVGQVPKGSGAFVQWAL